MFLTFGSDFCCRVLLILLMLWTVWTFLETNQSWVEHAQLSFHPMNWHQETCGSNG
jgi:hypothetical protein